ncbi:MAG: hypothetical protein V1911_02775 [Candidatus Micrarchaeota archaeon]
MAIPIPLLSFFDSLNPFRELASEWGMLLLAFKLVMLMFIIQFVRSRFGGGPIVTILVLIFAYLGLFTDLFAFLGPLAFVYMFITFGFTALVFDMAIAKPWKKMDMGGHEAGEASTEYKEKMEQMRRMR